MPSLEAKIKAIAQSKAQELIQEKANKVADDVKELVRTSIQEWYDSYSPRSYRRTFATHAAPTRICEISANSAKAGVEIRPEEVPDMYTHDPVSYVFPRTFNLGIHGTIGTGGQTRPPREILTEKLNAYKASLK